VELPDIVSRWRIELTELQPPFLLITENCFTDSRRETYQYKNKNPQGDFTLLGDSVPYFLSIYVMSVKKYGYPHSYVVDYNFEGAANYYLLYFS